MTILRFLPLLLLPTAAARPPAPASDTVVISHVDVIDTAKGNILRDRAVVVRKGRIAAIEKPGRPPTGAVVIDGTDKYLIPGLWDMHSHLDENSLPQYLAYGVTVVRAMGDCNPTCLPAKREWQRRIEAGDLDHCAALARARSRRTRRADGLSTGGSDLERAAARTAFYGPAAADESGAVCRSSTPLNIRSIP
jgi:hypothetical protein